VLGPSGSGKTTLLRTLAGFEQLSAGSVQVLGTDLGRLGATARAAFRAANIGFVDQHYSRTLSPNGSCRDAVALPLVLDGADRETTERVADALLARVGLADRAGDRPLELSAASSSASPSVRRSRTGRAFCLPMSPPANSTPRAPRPCTGSWARSCGRLARRP
jgi:putative ABC transport system ATP-binding protein